MFGFYDISTFVGYLTLNPFHTNNQFYFKQYSLIFKTFQFQAIKFSQTVLFQTIQFSVSVAFVYIQLNVKTVLFQTFQFSISSQFSSI